MTNNLHPPQTPRSTSNGTRSGVTPSFSFGLGFLPSFQFSSPMNIINSLSPQRFFQVSNNLNKVVDAKNEREHEQYGIEYETKGRSDDKQTKSKKNMFNSFTPPPSSGTTNNKFLDAIASQVSKKHRQKGEENNSSNELSIDVSSLNTDNTAGNDTTDLTSVYVDETRAAITPNTNIKNKNLHESQLKAAPKLVPIKPRTDILAESLDSSTPLPRSFNASASKTSKKRKISHDFIESPSTSIASKIDILASPAPRKLSRTDTSSIGSANTYNDKVWYPEIDEILLSSYLKFKTFKEHQEPNTSILKYSSQNKILSRMLLNKTGVLRTPKQIASRLFRLTKLKRPAKYGKDFNESPILNEELDALMNTPLEDLIDSSKIDSIDSEDIDKELGGILSSSPIFIRGNNEKETSFPDFKTNLPDKKCSYSLHPKELSIMFNDKTDHHNSHKFTTFHSTSHTSMTQLKLRNKLNTNINKELNSSLLSKVISYNIPIWLVRNNLNVSGNKAISPSSDLSPFSSTPSMAKAPKVMNLEGGSFSSYIKINVTINNGKTPDMLQWKCMAKVYNGERLILKKNEIVNGYLNEQENTFDLQIPFLKDFWSGYLAFLNDGHDDDNELQNLSVMQIIYEDDKELCSSSPVYGVIIHEFKKELFSEGTSHLTSIRMKDRASSLDEVDEVDDNATEIADSSPCKNSSPVGKQISPSTLRTNQNLKIDIFKANNSFITQGPFTAPIYDASTVQKFNPNVVKQQEQLKLQIQHHQIQQQLLNKMQMQGQIQAPLHTQNHPQLQTQQRIQNQDEISMNKNIQYQPTLMPSRSTGNITQIRNFSQPESQFGSQNMNIQTKQQAIDTSSFLAQNQNENETLRSAGPYINTPQLPDGMVTSTPTKVINTGVNSSQLHSSQGQNQIPIQGQIFNNPLRAIPSHQQMMANGYTPFNGFPSETQGQYILQQQYQIHQQQQQHHMYMLYNQMQQQQFQDNFATNNAPPSNQTQGQQNKKIKVSNSESNKENVKPKEITFCPILEYDPSKDISHAQKKSTSKQGIGIHRFPVNTPVSMYKPKKK
ncbi:uncharacterized protein AC631_04830 [Debaryomyces fabryi]|uniref:TEA domain-containing protein n=1 Tax=Debaryomyces fabryi TaxID=58627 RepID=A0A0V1PT54_9ASCO|nr:uncharacterized protein AC631_04830 [Debaryomyces fabryi]KRZ99418.1 hypothetical protein AC631_04830 [Debaryomyces fabryi]CUM46174.1 unnamed protein product [Debaryomyces fabryi]